MKNVNIKILLVFLLSVLVVTTAHCNFFSKGESDGQTEKSAASKDMVYAVINVGRIIGNMVFTMDEDLSISSTTSRIKAFGPRSKVLQSAVVPSIIITVGIMAIVFLLINLYFSRKIIESLRQKGKRHSVPRLKL